MDRTTLTTACSATALGIGMLLLQSGANTKLTRQTDTETSAVEQLERSAKFPHGAPGTVSALSPSGPSLAVKADTSTAQGRINDASARINSLVANINKDGNTPGEIYAVMPELLRIIAGLELEEMFAVAENIDAPLNMARDPLGAVKMILLTLAAEQDPARVLSMPIVRDDTAILNQILSSVARTDRDAARQWLDTAGTTESQRVQFENSLAAHDLKTDFAAGFDRVDAMSEGLAPRVLMMIAEFGIAKEQIPAVAEALDKTDDPALRPQLASIVMRDAMTDGGVAAARARAAELGLTGDDLSSFLRRTLWNHMRTEAETTIGWASEALGAEAFAEALPNTIENWARHDFNAAGAWLGKLEHSPSRDAAIASYATTVVSIDPEAAATWAIEIRDEAQRKDTAEAVGKRWKKIDPAAAEAWFAAQGLTLPD